MIELGRVLAVHPESASVDVCLVSDGRRLSGVRVMASSASTNTGMADLPSVEHEAKDDPTKPLGSREMFAVIAFYQGLAVCLGFLHPTVSQLMFADKDRMVYRHSSDVYVSIDSGGNTELSHPSGTYLRIGETAAHEDLTGQDFDHKWKIAKNTEKSVHVHLSVKAAGTEVASLNISPGGQVVLSAASDITITSGTHISLQAPRIDLN